MAGGASRRAARLLTVLLAAAATPAAAVSLYEQQLLQPWPAGRSPLGVAISVGDTGAALTAAHVLAGCHRVWRLRPGGERTVLHIVGLDARNDLALLQAGRPHGPPLTALGLDVAGAAVWSVGPGVAPRAMTVVGPAAFETFLAAPQLDPGDSGTPLLNSDGELVGVASAVDGAHTIVIGASPIGRFLEYYGVRMRPPRRPPSFLNAKPLQYQGIMPDVFNVICT